MVVYAQYTLPLEQLDRGPEAYRFSLCRTPSSRARSRHRTAGRPHRRGLYLFIAGGRCGVGRDEAASAFASRARPRVHLGQAGPAGVLDASYRGDGPPGPGAGRTAKLYRRSVARSSSPFPSVATSSPAASSRVPYGQSTGSSRCPGGWARAEGRTLGAARARPHRPNGGTDRHPRQRARRTR